MFYVCDDLACDIFPRDEGAGDGFYLVDVSLCIEVEGEVDVDNLAWLSADIDIEGVDVIGLLVSNVGNDVIDCDGGPTALAETLRWNDEDLVVRIDLGAGLGCRSIVPEEIHRLGICVTDVWSQRIIACPIPVVG